MTGRRILVLLAITGAIALIPEITETSGKHGRAQASSERGRARAHRGAIAISSAARRRGGRLRRLVLLGRSVDHRPIVAYELGDPSNPHKALVVGCIHGNEPAGIAVVRRLAGGAPSDGADLWLVPTINPDGQAAGTRQNAHGVDLNRNFPWRWRPLGARGTEQYAGPHALSEPESRLAHSLIARLRPRLTIWFHQPLGVVDESGGSIAVERRFAHLARLPLRRLSRYPGSAASWQDHSITGSTAFVVELPPDVPSHAEITRWSAAVRRVATERAR